MSFGSAFRDEEDRRIEALFLALWQETVGYSYREYLNNTGSLPDITSLEAYIFGYKQGVLDEEKKSEDPP